MTILLALALLAVTVLPGLPRTLAADRQHRRYLDAHRRYQRYLARQTQRVLNSNLK